jgi:hypothetical protein
MHPSIVQRIRSVGSPVLACVALVACSQPSATTSGNEGAGGADTASVTLDAGLVLDARVPAATRHLDASGPVHTEAPSALSSDCEPGSYAGDFNCQVDGLYPWGGTLSFSLIAARVTGADIVYLEIRPGTRVSGMDTMGGVFGGDLAGMFDCASGTLTGSLNNGTYEASYTGTIALAGDLSGQYLSATDAGVPGFSGKMGPLTNPDWDGLGPLAPTALCDWTAVRVSGAEPDDAGGP